MNETECLAVNADDGGTRQSERYIQRASLMTAPTVARSYSWLVVRFRYSLARGLTGTERTFHDEFDSLLREARRVSRVSVLVRTVSEARLGSDPISRPRLMSKSEVGKSGRIHLDPNVREIATIDFSSKTRTIELGRDLTELVRPSREPNAANKSAKERKGFHKIRDEASHGDACARTIRTIHGFVCCSNDARQKNIGTSESRGAKAVNG